MITKIELFGLPIYTKYEFKGITEKNAKALEIFLNRLIEAQENQPYDIINKTTKTTIPRTRTRRRKHTRRHKTIYTNKSKTKNTRRMVPRNKNSNNNKNKNKHKTNKRMNQICQK